jgi:N-acyl homoserine lactone hydrolase
MTPPTPTTKGSTTADMSLQEATGRAQKLWALDAPTLTVPTKYLVDGAAGIATIPVPVYVIQHSRGLLLMDTGIKAGAYDDPVGTLGEEAIKIKLTARPDQRPDRQLKALGLSAEDVTHVVVTHLHMDHTGAIDLFPNAQLYIGPGEFEWAENPTEETRHIFDWPTINSIRDRKPLLVPEEGLDIFGDGSVHVFRAPGHTPGQLAMLIHLEHSTFLLPSDSAHMRVSIENLIPDGLAWDIPASIETLKMLARLRGRHDAKVWITHDPEDWTEFRHAPHYYE